MDDLEYMRYAMERGVDGVIADRTARGKRLAQRFSDLPKGMSSMEFMGHPEVADLDLDFITASEMYDAYLGEQQSKAPLKKGETPK